MPTRKAKTEPADDLRIVVTPKMIEAGAAMLTHWRNGSAYDLAAAVYRAMAEVAPVRRSATPLSDATLIEVLRVLGHAAPKR